MQNQENLTQNQVHDEQSIHDSAEKIQLMTFIVDDQEYAIDVMQIKEIKGWMPTTTLPNTPEYIIGVINLRGSVVPIIDLKCRFGKGRCEPSKNHVVMIIMINERIMGILVDAVSDIISSDINEIKAIPSLDNTNEKDAVLKGLINHDNRLVAFLNVEKIFDQSIEIEDLNNVLRN